MKKVYKVALIFLIILNLYSILFQSQAAGPGGGGHSAGGGSRPNGTVSGSSSGTTTYDNWTSAGTSTDTESSTDNAESIWNLANNFINIGQNSGNSAFGNQSKSLNDVRSQFSAILGVLWGLGLLVIFISTVVLGIRYMLVNPNEKSRIKQATTPYIIGVVVIFGAVTIWRLIINILEG